MYHPAMRKNLENMQQEASEYRIEKSILVIIK